VLIEIELLQDAALHNVDTGAFLEIPAPHAIVQQGHDSNDLSTVMEEKSDEARMGDIDFLNSCPVFNSSVPPRNSRI